MSTLLQKRPGRSVRSSWGRGPLGSLRDEIDEMVGRLWAPDEEGHSIFAGTPSLDLSESDKDVSVKVDLPGVEADEIDIQLNANVLTISGDREEEKEDKGRTYHRVERRSGSFSRSVALPCVVEESEVAAEFHDGTLTVTLPKSEAARSRKIQVKS
jgi:HSP20 family protein